MTTERSEEKGSSHTETEFAQAFSNGRVSSPSPTPQDPQQSPSPFSPRTTHLTSKHLGTGDSIALLGRIILDILIRIRARERHQLTRNRIPVSRDLQLMAAREDLGRRGMHGEQLVANHIVARFQALRDRVGVAVVAGLGQGIRGPGPVGVLPVLGDLEPDCFLAGEVLGAVYSIFEISEVDFAAGGGGGKKRCVCFAFTYRQGIEPCKSWSGRSGWKATESSAASRWSRLRQ